jgi:tetratricopeptide (TPR) repeat protein
MPCEVRCGTRPFSTADSLRAAEALAERRDDNQRLGRIACYLCLFFSVMGEHDRAIAVGQRALTLATTSGAFDIQVVAQANLGSAYYRVGDFWQALDVSRQVMALLTGELHYARSGLINLPAVASRGYVAWSLAELGDFAEGSSLGEDAVRIAEAAEQPYSLAFALVQIGLLSRRQGALHAAIPVLERSMALCQTADIPRLFPVTASLLGVAYALAGHAAEALPLLAQALERIARCLSLSNRPRNWACGQKRCTPAFLARGLGRQWGSG